MSHECDEAVADLSTNGQTFGTMFAGSVVASYSLAPPRRRACQSRSVGSTDTRARFLGRRHETRCVIGGAFPPRLCEGVRVRHQSRAVARLSVLARRLTEAPAVIAVGNKPFP
jgi:hypothetical protein